MYRFFKSSKFYVGDVAIDDQKRREGNKKLKAQLIKDEADKQENPYSGIA